MLTGRLSPLILLVVAVGIATADRLGRHEINAIMGDHILPWIPRVGAVAALFKDALRSTVGKVAALLGGVQPASGAGGVSTNDPADGGEEHHSGDSMAILAAAACLGLFVYLFWPLLSLVRVLTALSALVVGSDLMAPLAGQPIILAGGGKTGAGSDKKEN